MGGEDASSTQSTREAWSSDDVLPERQDELHATYDGNKEDEMAPYAGVPIRTRREVEWILQERGWSTEHTTDLERVADFRDADFRDAQLHAVDLRGANLHGAIFDGADLSEAKLDGADLSYGIDPVDTSRSNVFLVAIMAVYVIALFALELPAISTSSRSDHSSRGCRFT